MNENKQMGECNQTMVAQKVKKTYSVKNYRAFLVNALNFQAEQYQEWEKYEDQCHNLLRKAKNKDQSKTFRTELIRIGQQRKKVKAIIDNITVAIQSLNEYESYAGLSYKLSDEMIAEERAKYFKPKEEEVNE